MFPAVVAADGLAGGDEPGPVAGQSLAFGGFELAAVLGQRRCGDRAVLAEAHEFGAEAAGPDGLGLVGVAQAPQDRAGRGGDGGEDDLGVGGGDLGHLVEDHDRPGPESSAVAGETGDGHGLDAGLAEFAGGLVGRGQADDRMASPVGGDGGGVDGGGLPEPGRGDQGADGRARLAQGPDGVGLVGAEAGFLGRDGLFDQGGVEAVDGEDGEFAEVVEDPLLQRQVIEGGVLGGAPARAITEEDGVVGVEERLGQVLDGLDVEAAGAQGGDLLHDVGGTEAGSVGAEPVLRVDERLDDVGPFQPGAELGDGPVAHRRFERVADRHPEFVGFALPPLPEHFGGERPVLAGPGGQRRGLVGPHPHDRVRVLRAGAGQVLVDRYGPLRERPQPSPVESFDLPASVAVRPPLHAELLGEAATELLLVDGAGRLAPLVERGGVESGVAPVGAAAEIDHDRVRVKLGVAIARSPVDERGRRHARRDPLPFTLDHLAGRPGPPLEELQRHRHRLHVGDRRHRRHLRRGERPQQRHRLRRRERHVERRHRPPPSASDQHGVGRRIPAQQQAPQRVGLDNPGQAQLGRQATLPHARRLAAAHVVVVDPHRHLGDQVLRVGQLRDPQHPGSDPERRPPRQRLPGGMANVCRTFSGGDGEGRVGGRDGGFWWCRRFGIGWGSRFGSVLGERGFDRYGARVRSWAGGRRSCPPDALAGRGDRGGGRDGAAGTDARRHDARAEGPCASESPSRSAEGRRRHPPARRRGDAAMAAAGRRSGRQSGAPAARPGRRGRRRGSWRCRALRRPRRPTTPSVWGGPPAPTSLDRTSESFRRLAPGSA